MRRLTFNEAERFALGAFLANRKLFLRRNSNPLQNSQASQTSRYNIQNTSMDTTMADSAAQSSRYGQVQVYFITNSPDIELPEEKRKLLVPTRT
jgi:hypothetical protein